MKEEFINHLKKYLPDEEISSLIKAQLNETPYNALLVDEDKISIKEIQETYPFLEKHPFVNNAFIYQKNQYEFGKSLLFELGAFYILEPCSLMVNYFLNPTKDDIVLDCCASPGGKLIHASFLMKNKGLIIANELNPNRAMILSSNVEKYGRRNVVVTNNDILDFPSTYNNTFTKIILDAPCSGSGMFRKENKMEEDWSYQKVLKLQSLQKEIILKAYKLLKNKGTMVYSTCSFSYEEDEEIIKYLLENTNAKIIPIEDNSYFYQSSLKGTIHLLPSHFKGEGHFIALIKKDEDEDENILKKAKLDKQNIPYNLDGYLFNSNNNLYLASTPYKFEGLKIIRNGIFLGEQNNKLGFIPTHHLSRVSNLNLPYIDLDKEETLSYIEGNVLRKDYKDGYYFLKFKNIPFALTKISNKTLKNHYPKGLRKKIRL